MALPHPQFNKDNGCRQMDGEFLPLLQTDHLDTYLYEISQWVFFKWRDWNTAYFIINNTRQF